MLKAISPIDGRYQSKTSEFAEYFSEYALIKYRTYVEIQYFKALLDADLPELSAFDRSRIDDLVKIATSFSEKDAEHIKSIERTTNHDVKAVEYHIKAQFDNLGWQPYKEFIHFGLTSQDINNTAVPLSIKNAIETVFLPMLEDVIKGIRSLAEVCQPLTLLARTHGQPASPTNFGKEFMVFVERLETQLTNLKAIPITAKFGGATGNFNAHAVAYPDKDWIAFGNQFVEQYLGMTRQQFTTQIEHYDELARMFYTCKVINTILMDFCRDVWTYISRDYFKQKIKKDEVGSSAMPHKVNPIDFENAEGNLGIANALFNHLSEKLPISRLQRDLTDSTVLRNVGVPFSHTVIAFKSISKGLGKLLLNEDKIKSDLEDNWAVVAEAIQSILRRISYPKPYEALKALTRVHKKIDQQVLHEFIDALDISDDIKTDMKQITPQNYSGKYPSLLLVRILFLNRSNE